MYVEIAASLHKFVKRKAILSGMCEKKRAVFGCYTEMNNQIDEIDKNREFLPQYSHSETGLTQTKGNVACQNRYEDDTSSDLTTIAYILLRRLSNLAGFAPGDRAPRLNHRKIAIVSSLAKALKNLDRTQKEKHVSGEIC